MSRLTALAYSFLYLLALPVIVIRLLLAPGPALLRQRLGFGLPRGRAQSIWLHGSSVGEVALLEPIVAGRADVVYGSRYLRGGRSSRRLLDLANRFLTAVSNACTGLGLTDMETCYKAFRADVATRLDLRSNRFSVEPEITAKVARLGARVVEVPIDYAPRSWREGKKIGWRDGIAALCAIVRFRFAPR